MRSKDERWAIFWCDLLKPIIFSDIEPEGEQAYLKMLARQPVSFPDGRVGRTSLSTLRRKLKRYRRDGFCGLQRKPRSDRGDSRSLDPEILAAAVELKKEQPYRSDRVINRFIEKHYGVRIPKSTLYRHLKQAGATRIKLGICKKPVRKRFTKDHSHDLWVGDFEEGPYVIDGDQVLPTYLSAFIDCHSRYVVQGRYYPRQSLDVLIDAMIRALSVHGAPLAIYVDNAKVYHSRGLKSACYRINTRLIYRPKGDPSPGGVIERLFGTVQSQFEAEVRAGDILTLQQLNRHFSAWLAVAYHQQTHSETGQTPEKRLETGMLVRRPVDMDQVVAAFMQRVRRKVNPTFSDVQLNRRTFAVDPRLRGDTVEVRYDPFSDMDTVQIHDTDGRYLCTAKRHCRQSARPTAQFDRPQKPRHSFLDLVTEEHEEQLREKTTGVDERKSVTRRPWSFAKFLEAFAELYAVEGGISGFCAHELEMLKKTYNHTTRIDRGLLKQAFEQAPDRSIPGILTTLKHLTKEDR